MTGRPVIRALGRIGYSEALIAMKTFTAQRDAETPDEIWWLEHYPVITLGEAADSAHVLDSDGIDVVRTDRGGEVTYHCPGQLVVYPLLDLRRHGLFAREYVRLLEDAVIKTLADFGIAGFIHEGAPGVYVSLAGGTGEFRGEAKIASIGIRISRGCTCHGISLNVDADLSGFRRINPCGYYGLRTINMKDLCPAADLEEAAKTITGHLAALIEKHDRNRKAC